MTINEARLIREMKKRCTYRRLAEIYYPEDHDEHGLQMSGQDLCFEAFQTLYPELDHPFLLSDEEVPDIDENKSVIGDFFWWE